MSSSLEYRHVSKRYKGAGTPALDGISIRVGPGEVVALVGESGSGKSTFLRLAAGLDAPDSGQILLDDEVVSGSLEHVQPEKRGVGLVFQDGALFPHLSVAENVAYGLKGRSDSEVQRVVGSMLEMVGLDGFDRRYPHELSGGERQRLAVVRALAPAPRVVLMDEPFSNLDPALRRSLRDEIRTILTQLGTTAVIVTHDTDDALAMASRVAILRDGRIVQHGQPGEVYHKPNDGYCARLFGPANRVERDGQPPRWVRPEDMVLSLEPQNGASRVEVVTAWDAGRRREVSVTPAGESQGGRDERWLVYDHSGRIEAGMTAWVTLVE